MAKLSNWREIFPNQSIKLQMMAQKTAAWQEWDNRKKVKIEEFELDIVQRLNEFMAT